MEAGKRGNVEPAWQIRQMNEDIRTRITIERSTLVSFLLQLEPIAGQRSRYFRSFPGVPVFVMHRICICACILDVALLFFMAFRYRWSTRHFHARLVGRERGIDKLS